MNFFFLNFLWSLGKYLAICFLQILSQSLTFQHAGSTSVPLGFWRNGMVVKEILLKEGSEGYKTETEQF